MLLEGDSVRVGGVVHCYASIIEGERVGLEDDCDKQLEFFHSSIFLKAVRHSWQKPSRDLQALPEATGLEDTPVFLWRVETMIGLIVLEEQERIEVTMEVVGSS
jgi:hypothetical protein